MPRSDWEQRLTPLVASGFCILAILGIVVCVWALGVTSGRDSERREYAPRAYQEGAKASAHQACIGRDPSAVFECVYEKIEASKQAAHDEQDLTAQQRAATSAAVAAGTGIVTLFISILGLWFIKGTLEVSREAMQTTERIGKAQVRAYLSIRSIGLTHNEERGFQLEIAYINSGQSPARYVHIHSRMILLPGPLYVTPMSVHAGRDFPSSAPEKIVTFAHGIPNELKGILLNEGMRLVFEVLAEYRDVFDDVRVDPFQFDCIDLSDLSDLRIVNLPGAPPIPMADAE